MNQKMLRQFDCGPICLVPVSLNFDNWTFLKMIILKWSLFYQHLNVNLWRNRAYKIALIFLTFLDSLEKMRHDLRDTTEKIEIEMKEVKETLCSLTTKVEKGTDEDWLLERASHR